MLKQKCTIAWASCNISPPSTEFNSRKFSHLPLPSATSMKSKTNYTVCSTVIFYDSLGSNFCRDSSIGHPPFKNFDNNQKTLLIFDNVDPHICRLQICNEESVGNTMYSRGNTEIKLWLFVVVSDELNSLVKCRRRKSNYPPHLGLMKRS